MANSIFQKLAFATAGAALSLAVIEAHPAHAATITYDFQVDVTSGPLSGNSYDGNFSYDDTTPSPSPFLLPYFEVSDFNFDFAGRTYTKSDLRRDCRYGPSLACFPLFIPGGEVLRDPSGGLSLIPRGGTLAGFQFGTFNSFGPPYPGFFVIRPTDFTYQLPFNPGEPPSNIGSGTVTYSLRQPSTSVPEPSTVFGLGVLGLGWLVRKKIASYQRA